MNTPNQRQFPGLDMMGLVLLVWICSLPFIGLVIVPLFGTQTALTVAIALLIAALILCWGRCILGMPRMLEKRLRNRILRNDSLTKQ